MLKTKTHKGRWGRENLQRPLGALGWIPVSVFGVFGSGPYRPKEAQARCVRVVPLERAPAPVRRGAAGPPAPSTRPSHATQGEFCGELEHTDAWNKPEQRASAAAEGQWPHISIQE